MLVGFTHRLKQELLALLRLDRYTTLPLKTLKFFKPPYYPNIITWVGGLFFLDCEFCDASNNDDLDLALPFNT